MDDRTSRSAAAATRLKSGGIEPGTKTVAGEDHRRRGRE